LRVLRISRAPVREQRDDIVAKPFATEALLNAVDRAVTGSMDALDTGFASVATGVGGRIERPRAISSGPVRPGAAVRLVSLVSPPLVPNAFGAAVAAACTGFNAGDCPSTDRTVEGVAGGAGIGCLSLPTPEESVQVQKIRVQVVVAREPYKRVGPAGAAIQAATLEFG